MEGRGQQRPHDTGQHPSRRGRRTLRRRHDQLHSFIKVSGGDLDRVDVQQEFLVAGVDLRVAPAQRQQRRLRAQRLDVGAAVAHAPVRHLGHESGEQLGLPLPRVDGQDGPPRLATVTTGRMETRTTTTTITATTKEQTMATAAATTRTMKTTKTTTTKKEGRKKERKEKGREE